MFVLGMCLYKHVVLTHTYTHTRTRVQPYVYIRAHMHHIKIMCVLVATICIVLTIPYSVCVYSWLRGALVHESIKTQASVLIIIPSAQYLCTY